MTQTTPQAAGAPEQGVVDGTQALLDCTLSSDADPFLPATKTLSQELRLRTLGLTAWYRYRASEHRLPIELPRVQELREKAQRWLLSVSASDRVGLLYSIDSAIHSAAQIRDLHRVIERNRCADRVRSDPRLAAQRARREVRTLLALRADGVIRSGTSRHLRPMPGRSRRDS